MCAIDTLPGPATIITRLAARRSKSYWYAPSPLKFEASFTWNIAPSIIIANREEEILDKTPTIKRIPAIVSARAIGICNSAGSPKGPVSILAKPGPNLPDPSTIKIAPIVALRPQNAISCNLFLNAFLVVQFVF